MDYTSKVESLLSNFCGEKVDQAFPINERYGIFWQEIKHYLLSGGKRIRPQLVMHAYEAYGGNNHESLIPVASAWELLHACLLVHDDIIDRDLTRHGQPNLAGKYQSIYAELDSSDTSHYALSAALIAGDLLLMSGYEMINLAPLSSDEKILAQSYLSQAVFAVAGGELIDTDSVLYGLEKADPVAVAKYKTASYSLQLPLQCGAALAGATERELRKLSTIGLHAGIAYQLRDDLLGVYGDTSTTGKSNRSDIIEKKRTLLVMEALKTLEPEPADMLSSFLAPDYKIDDATAEKIVELITLSGAKERVELAIDQESAEALKVIEELSVSESYKQVFSSLIAKLTNRNS